LHSITTILSLAAHTEVVARELVTVLYFLGACNFAQVVHTCCDGSNEVLTELGDSGSRRDANSLRQLRGGESNGGMIELHLWLNNDLESLAAFHAAARILTSALELRQTREERNERSRLWPVEELATNAGNAVVSGHMRKLMTFAQRVAHTT